MHQGAPSQVNLELGLRDSGSDQLLSSEGDTKQKLLEAEMQREEDQEMKADSQTPHQTPVWGSCFLLDLVSKSLNNLGLIKEIFIIAEAMSTFFVTYNWECCHF